LIELILVMSLLVVVVSMIVPKLSTFIRGRALDTEAWRLQALAHAGQSRAVSEGMPMVLWLDQKNGTYGLQQETPDDANGDPKAETLHQAESLQLSVANLAGFGSRFGSGSGTGSKTGGGSANGGGMTTFHNLPAIRFQADGTVDTDSPNTVQLLDSTGDSLWLVQLKNRTGYEIRDTVN